MSSIYSRTRMLIGEDGVKKLKAAHVAVFGLGGVGSYTAEALARSGVGELTLVDNDTIAESNLNRQLYALHSTLGMPKTEAAAQRVLDINPACRVHTVCERYLPENAADFFEGARWDYIADAVDTMAAKIDLAVRAREHGIPLIACMGTGNKFDASRFRVSDIYETSVCPICRVLRRELKKRGVPALRVVWSDEEPMRPAATQEPTNRRATPGSMPYVPPVAGMLLAGEIVTALTTAVGEPSAK